MELLCRWAGSSVKYHSDVSLRWQLFATILNPGGHMSKNDEVWVELAQRLTGLSMEQSNQLIALQLLIAFVLVEISKTQTDPSAYLLDVSARLSGLAELTANNIGIATSTPDYSPDEIARTIDRVSTIVAAALSPTASVRLATTS